MNAVITGGTRGIGGAVTEELLKKGYNCLAVSRTEPTEFLSLKEKYNNLKFFSCDISDIDNIDGLRDFVSEEYGKFDLLVNCAGVAPRVRRDMLEITPEDFDFVMDINLKGTYFVTQKLSALLNDNGKIVNISSMSAYTASVNRAEYCISKAGISMITKLFAARLAEKGIAVLEIRPGIIDTDMTSSVKEKYENMIEDGVTPIKRMGKPLDIAKCVLSISEGNFDFCTGSVIDCDGGFGVRRL